MQSPWSVGWLKNESETSTHVRVREEDTLRLIVVRDEKTYRSPGTIYQTDNGYDNAIMDIFFSTLKAECVTSVFSSRADARRESREIFECIEVWYNRHWRLSALGYYSPETYEQLHYQALAVPSKAD